MIDMWSLFDNAGGGGGGAGVAGGYSTIGPPADSTTWTVTHSLNSSKLIVQVYELSTGQQTGQLPQVVDANTVQIISVPTMTMNAFRVQVLALS